MNARIADLLGVNAADLSYLQPLDASAVEKLAADIEAAQVRSREEIKRAGDEAISHLPRLLQKPLRKFFP